MATEMPPAKSSVTSPKDARETSKTRPCVCDAPKRYVITVLLSLGMFFIHAMRVNVAVTVVTILDKNVQTGDTKAANDLPDVDWSAKMVGVLHSVFYMGYLVTQIPGGYLATIFPAHRLFGGIILCSGTLNLLIPLAVVRVGYGLTCAIRIVQGLFEGMLYPTCYAVLRHWSIPEERSRMGAIVLTGVYLGPVVGLSASGSVTHYMGWQYVYYIHGFATILWFLFWLFLSYETPSDHPHITKNELLYIEKSKGETATIYKNEIIPWRSIFTSLPVLAINVANFARNWVFYLLLTNQPLYINMFNFTIAENGLYSSIPHALMALVAIISGPLADLLNRDTMLTRTNVRKMFTGIGFGSEGACLLMLGFIYTGVPALIFLSIGIGLSGLTVSGWQINHLDLAPRYAGVLVGLSTTVGTVAGIMIPLVAGHMTQDMTIGSWQNVFILTANILFVAILFYSCFASGEVQSWAEIRPTVQIVHKAGPLEGNAKPYGTFPAQTDSLDMREFVKPQVNVSEREHNDESPLVPTGGKENIEKTDVDRNDKSLSD